jgi:hypothetical protein
MSLLGQRALNLLQGFTGSSGDRAPTSIPTGSTAHLSSRTRIHKWYILVGKIAMVFRHTLSKQQTIAVLGKEAYLRIFQAIKATAAPTAAETVVRMIKGQIVGKMIPPPLKKPKGQAEPRVPPDECKHEPHFMKPRGNDKKNSSGKGIWWTCIMCNSRWERRLVDEVPEGTPQDSEVLTFGKHAGQTFLDASIENPKYCEWVVGTVTDPHSDPCPQMQRFSEFLLTQERTLAGNMEQDMEEVESLSSKDSAWDAETL